MEISTSIPCLRCSRKLRKCLDGSIKSIFRKFLVCAIWATNIRNRRSATQQLYSDLHKCIYERWVWHFAGVVGIPSYSDSITRCRPDVDLVFHALRPAPTETKSAETHRSRRNQLGDSWHQASDCSHCHHTEDAGFHLYVRANFYATRVRNEGGPERGRASFPYSCHQRPSDRVENPTANVSTSVPADLPYLPGRLRVSEVCSPGTSLRSHLPSRVHRPFPQQEQLSLPYVQDERAANGLLPTHDHQLDGAARTHKKAHTRERRDTGFRRLAKQSETLV